MAGATETCNAVAAPGAAEGAKGIEFIFRRPAKKEKKEFCILS